jgi:hypothetical protein
VKIRSTALLVGTLFALSFVATGPTPAAAAPCGGNPQCWADKIAAMKTNPLTGCGDRCHAACEQEGKSGMALQQCLRASADRIQKGIKAKYENYKSR